MQSLKTLQPKYHSQKMKGLICVHTGIRISALSFITSYIKLSDKTVVLCMLYYNLNTQETHLIIMIKHLPAS